MKIDKQYLRPHADLGLGIGWDNYVCCNYWHIDLSASYEFHAFWNQNVLPGLNNGFQNPTTILGDLYLHGIVLSARLDF